MTHAIKKPTKEQVDAMLESGLSIRQIAKTYGWSTSTIHRIQQKKDVQKKQQTDWKVPITKEERIEARKKCRIGDRITVYNYWKWNKYKSGYGRWETSRIKKKFRYIVLLENGRAVDYAEVAWQRRKIHENISSL